MPKPSGRRMVSDESRLRKAQELRKKQQLALEAELRMAPSILKNRLLLPRPEFPTENCSLLPRQVENCEPIPPPLTQVSLPTRISTGELERCLKNWKDAVVQYDNVMHLACLILLREVNGFSVQAATVGLAATVESGGSSKVLQETIADDVHTLKQIGVLYPAVLAPAPPNQTIKTPITKLGRHFIMERTLKPSSHDIFIQKSMEKSQSKKSATSPNSVVESGMSFEEVEVKVELCDFLCDERIPPEEDGLETISEKETPVNHGEEPLSLDTESSAKRKDFSEENNCSFIVKEEVNDSSLVIKEEENYSSFIIKEEEINSSLLVIKKEENVLEFVGSPSMSPERTVNELENVETQADLSCPLGDSIPHDQMNVHASIVMDTAAEACAEVEDEEFVETRREGPADAVNQNTVSSYLFVEANMINEDFDGSLDDSSRDSAYQANDVDPLCNEANPDLAEEILWSCSICKARFDREEKLDIHLRKHAAHDLVCPICNERFFDKKILSNHLKIHRDVIPKRHAKFPCTDCNERFANVRDLVEHCKIHSKFSNPFRCTDCKERFSEVQDLVDHCKIHKRCPFECDLCDEPARFATVDELEEHRKTHYSKTFKCPNCSKWFMTLEFLEEHSKTAHTSNRFKCTKCVATFEHHQSLGSHMHQSHGTKLISCFLCPELFTSKASLNSHLRNVHAKNGGLHSWKSWEAWKNRRAKNK